LSYRFEPRAHVLEKLNAEVKDQKKAPMKVFREFKEIGEDDIVVTIEHWYFIGKSNKSKVQIVRIINRIQDMLRKNIICMQKR